MTTTTKVNKIRFISISPYSNPIHFIRLAKRLESRGLGSLGVSAGRQAVCETAGMPIEVNIAGDRIITGLM